MTVRFDSVNTGDTLPPLTITVSASRIVAGALASGDFEVIHHDSKAAQQRGTPDIFLNILTTNGLLQRFVNDWAGPAGRIRNVDIRLGVPSFAGDTLHLSGVVQSKLPGSERIVELAVRGTNSRGEHLSATVRVALP
jgi:uncharacterized protein